MTMEPKQLFTELYRAQPTGETQPPVVRITINDIVPDHVDLKTARAFYRAEATILADALYKALPGGTIDALLVELLDRAASRLRVSHVEDADVRPTA